VILRFYLDVPVEEIAVVTGRFGFGSHLDHAPGVAAS
jgi:hypothetical protein